MTKTWDVLPAKDLTVQSNWRKKGDFYSAIRARLLIVRHELDECRDGNVKESHPISVDSIALETAHQNVTVFTDTMTAGLRFAVSRRVLDQLSSKITFELGAKVPGFSGKLGSELLSKAEYEFTETTEENLTSTKSFQITESEEKKHTITLNPGEAREAKLRLRYWPRRWDVYLHSYEAIEFKYRKLWFWRQVRETMKIAEPQVLGWPLFSMTYYEPQTNLVVTYEPVANELTEPEDVRVSALVEPMPRAIAPQLPSLSDLAKLAFPVTKQEKANSQVYVKAREREAPGPSVGRFAGIAGDGHGFAMSPKRGRAFGVKKAAAKKAVTKAAKKVPAKKVVMKGMKKAAKKAARK
jgi:hypothetical protein